MANYAEKLKELLKTTVELNASDLHLGVGRRPTVRVDGALIPLSKEEVLTAECAEGLVGALLTADQKQRLLKSRQLDLAVALEDVARFVMEKSPTFPTEVPTEVKDELYEGYKLKFESLRPAKMYAVISGHYVEPTQEHMSAKNVEKVEIGVPYAFSYTSQEFGKLKNTNPALHALIGAVRSDFSDYASNRLGDLKRAATKILNNGKTRERTANKDFAEWVEMFFKDAAPTRLKSAKARGDSSADEKRWNEAKVAFMVKWNA